MFESGSVEVAGGPKLPKLSAMAAAGTVKYGIIGVGMMGQEHLINLHHLRHERVAVVAVADPHVPSQQLALDLAQSFNWPVKVWTCYCVFAQLYGMCED